MGMEGDRGIKSIWEYRYPKTSVFYVWNHFLTLVTENQLELPLERNRLCSRGLHSLFKGICFWAFEGGMGSFRYYYRALTLNET